MGTLTVEKVQETKLMKKSIKLPTTVNPDTGKQSAWHTAFSEVSWGKPTQLYLKLISSRVDDEAMEAIMSETKTFMKASRKRDMQDGIDPDNDRVNLDEYPPGMSDDKWNNNDPLNGNKVEL